MLEDSVNAPPRRTPTLLVLTSLVLVGCVLVAGDLAALMADSSPLAQAIGVGGLVLPIVVGATQYIGVIRRNALATRIAAGLLLFLCAAYGVMGLISALAPHAAGPLDRLAPLAIATFLGVAAWQNYKWLYALQAYYKRAPAPPSRWQLSLTEIMGATLVVAVAAAIASYKISNLPKP